MPQRDSTRQTPGYHHGSQIHPTVQVLERADNHLSLWTASRSLQGTDRQTFHSLGHSRREGTGLHHGQFSGQPGRNTLTPVIMEELKNEVSHASRKSLINFDNDAASCYDRIIPALASLIGRKYGMHRNVIFVHAKTLEETKYKLKTSMGISDEFYTYCEAFPI